MRTTTTPTRHRKTGTRGVAVLVAVLLLSGCTTMGGLKGDADEAPAEAPELSYDQLMASGNSALRKGDLTNARISFALAVEREPQNIEALYNLAFVLDRQGHFTSAESLLRNALQLDPTHLPSSITLALVLLKSEKYPEAESRFSAILETRDDIWEAYNGLGVIRDMQGRHQDAQQLFVSARRIAPRSARVANNLGYSYYMAGNDVEAERHLRDAVRLDADYERAWANLALVYVRTGRVHDADAAFRQVVDQHQAANNIGYLGMLRNDDKLARQQLKRAIDLSPSHYELANRNLDTLDDDSARRQHRAVQAASAADVTPVAPAVNDTPVLRIEEIRGGRTTTVTLPESTTTPSVTPRPDTIAEGAPKKPAESTRRSANRVVSIGDSRRPVKTFPTATGRSRVLNIPSVKAYLAYLGYDAGPLDRSLGTQSRAAISAFQKDHELRVDGKADLLTRTTLKQAGTQAVQQQLLALGYTLAATTGTMDDSTRDALRKFQSEADLPETGELDLPVLQRLRSMAAGTGSQAKSDYRIDVSDGS